jgi:hypothetical protein
MEVGITRRNIGRLLLLAWAVMLAWLARRQFAQEAATTTAERTRRLEPGAQYFAVLAEGRQIGQLNLASDTLVDGVRLSEQFVLDLPVGDSTRQLARGQQYYLSRALRLRSFTRRVFGIGPGERLDATLGADSILSLSDAEGEGETTGPLRFRVDPDAILPGMLAYRAAFGGHLRVGERFSLPLIELGPGAIRRLEIRVAAESTFVVPDSAVWDSSSAAWVPATTDTVRAWRLDHDAPGAPTHSWVDRGGALVRQETDGGLTLVRSAFEIVGNNYRRGRKAESSAWRRAIPGMRALATAGQLPDVSVPLRQFLWGADSAASAAGAARQLNGGRQSLRGDTLTVWRDGVDGESKAEARRGLGAAAELAAADEEIRAAAKLAVNHAGTAADSVRALTRWVSQQIATDLGMTAVGTAGGTLRARRGGPDGKARLLAALALASGIPARAVSGIAVLPEGSFAHSWTELWQGRWIAADPTFGQLPASASLVRFSIGERSRPVDLLPLVASARFLPLRSPR